MILFNRNDSLMSDLLTPTGGSNLTFKVSFDFCISNDYLTFVTLAWSTKPVLSRWGIFVAIANNTLYGSKLELGGIPVHTEYRCLFFLRYEFLKYRNTGVI